MLRELVPRKMFFTTGVGIHREELISFEMALRDAGIARYNLVRVSSILPPRCEIVERDEGVALLEPGQVVFCVLSRAASAEAGRRVGATVAVAVPEDRDRHGYISECHDVDRSGEELGGYAEELARQMLATSAGEDAVVPAVTRNHTAVREAPGDGRWLTVVSAAVACG